MIEDFIDDLMKELTQRRSDEVEKLIVANGDGTHHSFVRGKVHGLEDAIASVRSLRSRYLREEEAA